MITTSHTVTKMFYLSEMHGFIFLYYILYIKLYLSSFHSNLNRHGLEKNQINGSGFRIHDLYSYFLMVNTRKTNIGSIFLVYYKSIDHSYISLMGDYITLMISMMLTVAFSLQIRFIFCF